MCRVPREEEHVEQQCKCIPRACLPQLVVQQRKKGGTAPSDCSASRPISVSAGICQCALCQYYVDTLHSDADVDWTQTQPHSPVWHSMCIPIPQQSRQSEAYWPYPTTREQPCQPGQYSGQVNALAGNLFKVTRCDYFVARWLVPAQRWSPH